MKKQTFILAVLFAIISIGLNAFIIYQSCLRGSASTQWSSPVVDFFANILNRISPGTINQDNISTFSNIIRKLFGHFGLFMMNGVFTTVSISYFSLILNLKKKKLSIILISLVIGVSISFLTEIIQLSIQGRSGEFTDALIDVSGYIIGFAISYLIAHFKLLKTPKIDCK